jgi:photosystem II stability/assembly factor-like uncharacterized protein
MTTPMARRRHDRRGARVLLAALHAAWPGVATAQEETRRADPVVTSLTAFAGTSRGLWRSANWGGTWELAKADTAGEIVAGIGAVRCILPVGPRVYLGGDGGLLVSEDFGSTWARTGLTTAVLAVLPSRYPQADPTLFAGTPEGLLKSLDGARSFRTTPLRGTPVHRLEWPGPALIAATGKGVLVSNDGGESFAGPGEGLPRGEARSLALSSFFPVDPVMFAGVGSAGVFRSGDGGRSWTPAGLAGHAVSDLVWLGPLLYAATDSGLFRSEDNGRSWVPLGEGLSGRAPRRLLFPLAPDSGAQVFVGTDDGVHRSADGGVRFEPTGLRGEEVLAVATFPPGERTPGRGRGKKR